MKTVAVIAAALSVAATGVDYLQAHQLQGGGFAEPGGAPSPELTAWAVLGLRAAGGGAGSSALTYLAAHESELTDLTDVELAAMAESVLGKRPDRWSWTRHWPQSRSSTARRCIRPTVILRDSTDWT